MNAARSKLDTVRRVARSLGIALFVSTMIGGVATFGFTMIGFFGGYAGVGIGLIAGVGVWLWVFVYLLRSNLAEKISD
jgi:hypothetical protein